MAVFSNNFTGPVAIPDNNATGITNFLAISGVPAGAFLRQIRVTLNITHTFDADLDIFLIDPDGNQIELSTNNGGSGDNFVNTVFVDSATTAIAGLGIASAPFTGSFRPEQALSTLYPGAINGNWRLKIVDEAGADLGNLTNWSIDLSFGEASRSIFANSSIEARSSVSAGRDGRFSVSWNSDINNGDINNRIFTADGATGVTSLNVSDAFNTVVTESMAANAMLRDGRHFHAYVTGSSGNQEIRGKLSTFGSGSSSSFDTGNVQSGDQVSPMVAELSDGNLIVAYVDVTSNTLQGRIFNTTTNLFGAAVTLTLPGATLAASPNPALQPSNLIALSGGGFVVSYVGGPGGAANYRMSIFDNIISNGEFSNTFNTTFLTSSAALVQLADGNFMRLVAGLGSSGQAGVIVGIFNTSGAALFPASNLTPVTGVPSAEFHNLRATLLLDGRVMIVGSSLVEGALAGSDIWGQVINANGTLDGTAFRINGDNLAGTQSAPDIATLADGRVVVTWTDHNANEGDIMQQIIDIRSTGVNLTGYQNLNEEWIGSRFADTFTGGAGNDRITGGAGDDVINGGSNVDSPGVDTAVFTGTRANYATSKFAGELYFADLRGGAPDGVDRLQSIERLQFSDSTVVGAESFTPVNFNGDLKSDLIWCNTNGLAAAFLMDGTTIADFSFIGPANGNLWRVKAVGDLNGDGSSDLIWQHTTGLVVGYTMNGTAISTAPLIANASAAFNVVGSGDFNSDGKSDIVLQNSAGQGVIWLMDGTTLISEHLTGAANGADWSIAATGDLNGDGKADLVWEHTDGSVVAYIMNGGAIASWGVISGANGPTYSVKGVGDLNGDSKGDIIWQYNNGQAGAWLMNGTNIIGGNLIGTANGSQWEVRDVSDLNGDGLMDLVWQDNNGLASGFLMNGTTIIGNGFIGAANGADWLIV